MVLLHTRATGSADAACHGLDTSGSVPRKAGTFAGKKSAAHPTGTYP